jgi:RNA polymerase sigma-70 factor, ECF subfamily
MNGMDQGVYLNFASKPHNGMGDMEISLAASTGVPHAFAELQRLYSQQLYNTIFRITRNREDTEDVLQDTLLRAYLALEHFEGRSSVYSWLTRIAINSALMLLRKRRNKREVTFDLVGEPENGMARLDPEDPRLNPEQICDQKQRCSNLQRQIERLQTNLREPLQTRMTHGSSLGEIAEALEITEAAVKARLYRARAKLNAARISAKVEGRGSPAHSRSTQYRLPEQNPDMLKCQQIFASE